MKQTMKSIICVLMTAMFWTASPATQGAADKGVPFLGSIEGVLEVLGVQFPTLSVEGNDTGNAIHLGQFTATWEEEINLLTNYGIGSGQFVAANGDSLYYDFTGQGTPTGLPNQVLVVEVATITGGTGRFAGASGSFIGELLVDLATGLTTGSFEGTIVLPRGK